MIYDPSHFLSLIIFSIQNNRRIIFLKIQGFDQRKKTLLKFFRRKKQKTKEEKKRTRDCEIMNTPFWPLTFILLPGCCLLSHLPLAAVGLLLGREDAFKCDIGQDEGVFLHVDGARIDNRQWKVG